MIKNVDNTDHKTLSVPAGDQRPENAEPKHTPGPWCFENIGEKENCIAVGTAWRFDDKAMQQIGGHIRNADDEGNSIYYTEAVCFIEESSLSAGGTMWGNARLIAAAPDMIDALQSIKASLVGQTSAAAAAIVATCDSAISKAEGRS